MRTFCVLFILIYAAASQAKGIGAPGLFEPVYAADQSKLTTKSQEFEQEQFRQWGHWRDLHNQMESKRAEQARVEKEYRRAVELAKNGNISGDELVQKEFAYNNGLANMKRVMMNIHRAKLRTGIVKQKILEEGNPDLNLRLIIARLMKMQLSLEKRDLEIILPVLNQAEANQHRRYLSGQHLHSKGYLATTTLEQRKLDWQNIIDQIATLKSEIDSTTTALIGIDKSIQRLMVEPE